MTYGHWVLESALHSYHLAYSPAGMQWCSQRKEVYLQASVKGWFSFCLPDNQAWSGIALYTDFTLEPSLIPRPSWCSSLPAGSTEGEHI